MRESFTYGMHAPKEKRVGKVLWWISIHTSNLDSLFRRRRRSARDPYLGEGDRERDLAESGRSSSCWAISTANTEKRRSNLNDVFSWTISNTRFGIRSHSTIKERRWSHLHLFFSFSFGLSYDLTQLHTQRPKREMNGRTKWMWCNHAKINIPLLSTNIIIKKK